MQFFEASSAEPNSSTSGFPFQVPARSGQLSTTIPASRLRRVGTRYYIELKKGTRTGLQNYRITELKD